MAENRGIPYAAGAGRDLTGGCSRRAATLGIPGTRPETFHIPTVEGRIERSIDKTTRENRNGCVERKARQRRKKTLVRRATANLSSWMPTMSVMNAARTKASGRSHTVGREPGSSSPGTVAGTLQRSAINRAAVPTIPSSVHETLRSPGQPLDMATRAFMEPRFGQDFSSVRVHADSHAADSARAVNARAYTLGNDVAFGHAQYAPGTQSGKELLAHELTHVIQQGSRKTASVPQALPVGDAAGPPEQEADQIARSITNDATHSPFPVEKVSLRSIGPRLSRKLVVNPSDTVPLAAGASGTAP